jgi:hypothetical protein
MNTSLEDLIDYSQAHSNKSKLHIHRDDALRQNIQIQSSGWAFLGGGR